MRVAATTIWRTAAKAIPQTAGAILHHRTTPLNAVSIHTGSLVGSRPGVRLFSRFTLQEPTIYALSTAPGRAAIAVIRISGPACLDIYHSLCPAKKAPKAKQAVVRTLFEPGTPAVPENVLDSSALLLFFPGPTTATGEDVLELHVHGGPAIVKAVLSAISRCTCSGGGKIRYAEPGEFTRRAFMNDRLDLTQVEALGDTLAASTEQQRRLSVRGTINQLAKRYEAWRQDLLYARGELEALIDFSEDQHFDESPADLCASVAAKVRGLQRRLRVHSQNAVRGELLRHGISISLLGAPNAGKSSLLNRIVGREAAIVSHEAGTTRDVVEVGLDLGGYFCRLGDTAGLRKAKEAALQGSNSIHEHEHLHTHADTQQIISQIEKEGMRRAKERAVQSDLVIVVLSFENNNTLSSSFAPGTKASAAKIHLDTEVLATVSSLVRLKNNVIVAVNKSDLLPSRATSSLISNSASNPHASAEAAPPEQEEDEGGAAAIQQIIHAIPGLHHSQIHLISCKPSLLDGESLLIPSPSTPSPALHHPLPAKDDSGQIQAFLRGLIAHFARLTAAVVPSSSSPMSPSFSTLPGVDRELDEEDPAIWQESLGATERHRGLLDECTRALDGFLIEVEAPRLLLRRAEGETFSGGGYERKVEAEAEADIVVAAEHLRTAADCLAKITGRGEGGDVEEVLGVVFEKFCVGK